jgi:hypothetical protein
VLIFNSKAVVERRGFRPKIFDEMLASAGREGEVITVEVIQSSRPLSEEEVRDRERLERTVERAFYQAGSALQELRDRRLYQDGYDSFEDYCRGRFGHSRQKANYLIMGAAIYRTLSAANCPLLPSSEYQVRPLAVLAPQRQPTVWNEAVTEAGGKAPSNRVVRETVDKYQVDILAAVKRTAIPHHATFLGWSLNGVDASPKNA